MPPKLVKKTVTGYGSASKDQIKSMIEKLLNIVIRSFGKPDKFYSNFLLRNFENIAYVIGDRVDTDILLANEINAKSYLVNSSIQNYLSDEIADFKFDKFSDCISSIIKNLHN